MSHENLCMGCMNEKGRARECPHCHWQDAHAARSPDMLPLRAIINRQYLVGRILGQGNYGKTYLAYHLSKKVKLTLKEFFPVEIVSRERGRAKVHLKNHEFESDFNYGMGKFIEEGMALEKLPRQPGTARVTAIFRANGTAYRAVEYAEGISLQDFLVQQGGKLPLELALKILTPVFKTLEVVHRNGLIHFDIYPGNIIVTPDGVGTVVNFSASGYSIAQQFQTLPDFLRVGFAAQELYLGIKTPEPTADVYSLAATLYCVLTGRVPPDALQRVQRDTLVSPSRIVKSIPRSTSEVITKALAIQSSRRFESVAQFREALWDSYFSFKRSSATPVLDAFTRVKCRFCATVNDVLTTDMVSGTALCSACHRVISEFSVEPSPAKADDEVTAEFATEAAQGFIVINCPICGKENEVLSTDLDMGAQCVACGSHLSAPAAVDLVPEEETEELPEAEPDAGEGTEEEAPPGTSDEDAESIQNEASAPGVAADIPAEEIEPSEAEELFKGEETLPETEESTAAAQEERAETAEETDLSVAPAEASVPENDVPDIPGSPAAGEAVPPQTADEVVSAAEEELIPIDCPKCRQRNHFAVESLLSGAQCRHCGHLIVSTPLTPPQEESGFIGRREQLKRRRRAAHRGRRRWPWIAAALLLGAAATFLLINKLVQDRMKDTGFQHYVESGDSFFEKQQYYEALANYRAALEYRPTDEALREKIVRSENRLLDEESQARQAAIQLHEDQQRFNRLLQSADSLMALGQLRRAQSVYQEALNDSPGSIQVRHKLEEIARRRQSRPAIVTAPQTFAVTPETDLAQTLRQAGSGAVFRLAAGIYRLDHGVVLNSDVRLVGAGRDRTLIISAADSSILMVQSGGRLGMQSLGIEYEGNGNAGLIVAGGGALELKDCILKRTRPPAAASITDAAIVFENSSSGLVENCRLEAHSLGILVKDGAAPLISENEFLLNGTALRVDGQARPRIVKNSIRQSSGNGLEVLSQAQPAVSDNLFEENRLNGINLEGSGFSGNFSDNRVIGNGGAGVMLSQGAQPILENNLVKGNSLGGLDYKDNARGILRKNTIEGNSFGGIRLANFARPDITGNLISENRGDGIELRDEVKANITGNRIINNSGDGISILLTKAGGFIKENTCTGNQGYGISILKAAKPVLVNNVISGNHEGHLYDEYQNN